jgi:hypothetical protein
MVILSFSFFFAAAMQYLNFAMLDAYEGQLIDVVKVFHENENNNVVTDGTNLSISNLSISPARQNTSQKVFSKTSVGSLQHNGSYLACASAERHLQNHGQSRQTYNVYETHLEYHCEKDMDSSGVMIGIERNLIQFFSHL